jgi:hypothetical protein
MFQHNTICTILLVGEVLDIVLTDLIFYSLIRVLTCHTIFFCILLKGGVVRRMQLDYRNISRYFWQLEWTKTDHSFYFIIYLPQHLFMSYFLGNM